MNSRKSATSTSEAMDRHRRFDAVLPTIRKAAARTLRSIPAGQRCEKIDDAVGTAWVYFVRLLELGRDPTSFASAIGRFAALHVLTHRDITRGRPSTDILSPQCQRRRRIGVVGINLDSGLNTSPEAILAETRRATPADIAQWRIDFHSWMGSLNRRQRRIAADLALGWTTAETAHRHRVTPGRISQMRRDFLHSWSRFVGEPMIP